jgi:catalase
LHGIVSFSEDELAKYLHWLYYSIEAGKITKQTKAVSVSNTPSLICLEYKILLKTLKSSLFNDIAPANPNKNLNKKARKDAKYKGGLKYSDDGLAQGRSFFYKSAAFYEAIIIRSGTNVI